MRVSVGRDGEHARLTVSDTGPGIAAGDVPHVFDRFWRGPSSAGTSGGGIGLAVVKRLVVAHGGTIDVQPSTEGASFTVLLPLAAPTRHATPAEGSPGR